MSGAELLVCLNTWRWMKAESLEEPSHDCVRQREFSHIFTFRIAARAPWQQGRVEGHGGLLKELIDKCRAELPPTSMTELVLILRECECAKNRFSNRSGFSPSYAEDDWAMAENSWKFDER